MLGGLGSRGLQQDTSAVGLDERLIAIQAVSSLKLTKNLNNIRPRFLIGSVERS